MKPLEAYTKRRTDRADLARTAMQVCQGAELLQATEVINKTAFSARDVKFWLSVYSKSDEASSTVG